MLHPVLNEDWSDYDNRRIRDGRDRSKFSCEEQWEVDYLVNKLRRYFPSKTDSAIRNAISSCCTTVRAPRPRQEFVECVVRRLNA
ncbi:hypothetical protein CCY01nite_21620 [Chitinophaga cymbidii]|uniref:Uncharacterized protein n=1 Tax=Chitinophaga cymbidii TaxID=1096750 RepID=A0A512RJQ5_9BACT|nr:hypothetical protein CCY01nite_21620 [Chitinophaga cymbidii]